jgi:hypothetical protein
MKNSNIGNDSFYSLAEAQARLTEIAKLLKGLRGSVTRVSVSRVPGLFNRANALLSEAEALERRVTKTEAATTLGGASMLEIKTILKSLDFRIKFIASLTEHQELPDEVLSLFKESMKEFQSTKVKLLSKYEEVIWEIELLE